MFVTIPMLNTIVKIVENLFDGCNESLCCISCSTYICKCCICCGLGIIDFCIHWSKCNYEDCKTNVNGSHFPSINCVWFILLVYELAFSGIIHCHIMFSL